MGSYIELNDTLRITKAQGFPNNLDIKKHLKTPYKLTDTLKNTVFSFVSKPSIRNYQQPPVRNFLVEDIDGKWIYWGLIHIIEITHDYINKQTSGKFQIIYLNSPDEMKQAHHLIDQNESTNYY